jgi:amidase
MVPSEKHFVDEKEMPVEEIIYRSAASIAEMIRKKRVSSEEVVRSFLDRIERVNPQLNAVVQLAGDRALAEARDADNGILKGDVKGPLHGVPITIKDSLDAAGIISTGGTKGRSTFVPSQDATVVARLRRAGAIVLGKTNTPELTFSFETDNAVYGRTNNPYDLSLSPGGSSGGSAAIVASGGSPLDIGSDTGGSIRVPSHFCGITCIKPTSGRVPRTGNIIPFGLGPLDSLSTIGPMARYVEDLALCLPIISGIDWKDPAIVPMLLGDPGAVELKRLSVAFFTDNGIRTPAEETNLSVEKAANALSGVVMQVKESRPDAVDRSLDLFYRLWMAYAGPWQQKLLLKAGTIERIAPSEQEKTIPAMALADLSEDLDRFRSDMLFFMKEYDAIVCPVNAYPAMPHDSWAKNYPAYSYTMTFSLTGWPVVVVRAGTSSEGLPIGVQIVARPWNEHEALALAQYIEAALNGWPRPFL